MNLDGQPEHALPPFDERELLSQALASIASAIFIADASGNIIWVNQAFCRLSGYERHELLGKKPSLLRSGRQDMLFYTRMWQSINAGRTWQGEVVDRRKDGTLYTVTEIITPLFDEQGKVANYIAIQHDITESKRESEQHKALAYHDGLTGLPNRLQFMDCLQRAIEHNAWQHKRFALMFVDLDRFKPVNDRYGHHVGDLLLIAVAKRLGTIMRSSDVLARLGGDEFTVIENQLSDPASAGVLAQKIISTLNRPFTLDRKHIEIGVSIGIAIFPDDGVTAAELLERADMAMYRAKNTGRNCCRFHEGEAAKP